MKKIYVLAALTLCASPVFAADRFADMDKDKNGNVVWEEFETAMPQMRKSAFESIDADKNGTISREEWDAFQATHGAKGGMPPSGMNGMGGMGGTSKMPPAGMEKPGQSAMPLIQPPTKTPGAARPNIMPPTQK